MYDMHEIGSNFYCIRYKGHNWPTASNVFLIIDKNGLNLIDTGLNRKEVFKGLSNCLHQLGYSVSEIHTVVLTHGHTDHIAGLNIIRKFCNPRVLLPRKCIPEATEFCAQEEAVLPRQVREIAPRLKDYDILDEFSRSCGEWELKNLLLLPIEEGDEVRLGNYSFQAIHTPGHDLGLMVFFEPEIKLLLTTDLLHSTIPGNALPWYSSTGGGVNAYLQSLDRVEKLNVDRAFPSHGTLSDDVRKAVLETRKIILGRETKILHSLKNAPKTCEQLDLVLYPPLVLKLCPWFSSVTEAHLNHLAGHGLIIKNGLEFILTSWQK